MPESVPDGWSVRPLAELAHIVSGGTPSRHVSRFWDGGTIAWVTPTDITSTQGKYLSETKDKITKEGLLACSASLLPSGSILMTSRATLGEAKISTVPTCTNQGFKSLIPNAGVLNEFLYYQIQRTKHQYARFGSGSTFLEVSRRDTATFSLLVPTLDVQAEIAAMLSLIDYQIEATQALIAKHELVRKGLMQDLFTRGVDQHGQLRPPREEASQLYGETELGWLPTDWRVTSLRGLVDQNRPICYGILMPGNHVPDGIPVIKVRDIKGGRIMKEDLLRTSAEIDAEYARSRLKEDDLLITIRGTVGRTAIVPGELAGANITQDTARVAIANGDSDFFREFLCSDKATAYLKNNTLGNAVQGINIRDLKAMLAPVPLDEEQAVIAGIFKAHRRLLDELISERQELIRFKSGLMQDLLTGRVSVAPLLDAAAA